MKTVKKFPQIVVSLLTAFGVMVSTIPVMAAESADSLSAEPVVTNLLSSLGESGNFQPLKHSKMLMMKTDIHIFLFHQVAI